MQELSQAAINYSERLDRIKHYLIAGDYDIVVTQCGTLLETALRSLYSEYLSLISPSKLEQGRTIERQLCPEGSDYTHLGLGKMIHLMREARVFDRLQNKTAKDYKAAARFNLSEIVHVSDRNAATHQAKMPPESRAGIAYYSLRSFLEAAFLLGPSIEKQAEREARLHYSLLRMWSKGFITEEELVDIASLSAELGLDAGTLERLYEQVQRECKTAITAYETQWPQPFVAPPLREYLIQQHNLPSVLGTQLQTGLREYLKATFPIATPYFEGLIDRFLAEPGKLFKGPFISVKLPFKQGERQKPYFPELHMKFRPYRHQELAFQRLGQANPQPTLIATGTGSGKTECFLYPILHHCYQHRGEAGIKAILIYPMNALATDQARRLAGLIWNTPELRDQITAGLYIGDRPVQAAQTMLAESIITDRDIIRQSPPDILITNYKMLDYMLTRPSDFKLWNFNQPETLQFLVVDEIHTFDGAQGTDLACLLRRLKSRLKTPLGYLCPVGTSATLGENNQAKILAYASSIFGETFDDEALIQEHLLPFHAFFEDAEMLPDSPIPAEWESALDPEAYNSYAEYIQAQYQIWFKHPLPQAEPDQDWRITLGQKLKSHRFFYNFIKKLKNRALTYDELLNELAPLHKELQNTSEFYQYQLLNSLVALVSSARSLTYTSETDPKPVILPFLNVRSQLWVRELSRMVASVHPQQPELEFSDDQKRAPGHSHLPLVQCRECNNVAWGAMGNKNRAQLNPGLKAFYEGFFNGKNDTLLVYPDPDILLQALTIEGYTRVSLCTSCLAYGTEEDEITHGSGCQGSHCLKVARVPVFTVPKEKSKNCPVCGGDNSLSIIGHGASSLTSVVIGQIFASRYSDDKKIIAFSDSVQDASYRAGFFTARTYQFTLRSALQQYLQSHKQPMNLPELVNGFCDYWLKTKSAVDFITTFLPADMTWLKDYEDLLASGDLKLESTLLPDVTERLSWEIYREFTFRSQIGRTLEKSALAMLSLSPERLEPVLEELILVLSNEIPELAKELSRDSLCHFVLALLKHLKEVGAVYHPGIETVFKQGIKFAIYASPKTKGGAFSFKPRWLPSRTGYSGPRPLTLNQSQVEAIILQSGRRSWYAWLAEKLLLSQGSFLLHPFLREAYELVLAVLTRHGILKEWVSDKHFKTWALDPTVLSLSRELKALRCDACHHRITVPTNELRIWEQSPCTKRPCVHGIYELEETKESFYGHFYRRAIPERIFGAEHTGLLARKDREAVETAFMANKAARATHPWYTNLLSCTPTLEMGIDIGDLSTVLLCSVPPAQSNYLQRIGRSGRHDGNSLNVTVASARPHDLYYFQSPHEMIAGEVATPGVFLGAAAVLERQLTAFCFDKWVESGIRPEEIDKSFLSVLQTLNQKTPNLTRFPYNLFNFISTHQTLLYEGFIKLFEGQLPEAQKEDVEKELLKFIQGDEQGSLSYRILERLTQLGQECNNYDRDIRRLQERIRKQKDAPTLDEQSQTELDMMMLEIMGLKKIRDEVKGKNLYNLLTDEGLLPNYAFPEEGITLRSIIYRRKDKNPQNENKYEVFDYEYHRPAATAIQELAPSNYFYAGGRKVRIDQIELRFGESEEGTRITSSDFELWRFCDQCSHMELEKEQQPYPECPRCSSKMWGDQGQVHKLIRLRQVFANTSIQDSLSGDEAEEREPRYFEKQLLVNFDPDDIESAHAVREQVFPFGFEYIRKVKLHDINFGESSSDFGSQQSSINKQPLMGKGFRLCCYCGKVQPRAAEKDVSKMVHAITCRRPKETSRKEDLVQTSFLYREFQSEALRIFLPDDPQYQGETCYQSFIAGIHLGLKKYFSGNIDHLSSTMYQEPIENADGVKNYLILYDSIPGGTGYLKQLARPEQFMDILQMSLDVLKSCACQQDPDLDGCYHCIFTYKQIRQIQHLSRTAAIELFSALLRYRDQLEPTQNISNIAPNMVLESVLERRFVEALRRIRSRKRWKDSKLFPEVVKGKLGYILQLGAYTYSIEPQVELGPEDGVAIPSRADFVIRSLRDESILPIAIFTDGYQFHHHRIGKDMAQRLALVHSGNYRVWTLSWNDVDAQLQTRSDNYFWNPITDQLIQSPAFHNVVTNQNRLSDVILPVISEFPKANAFDLLLFYLSHPNPQDWRWFSTGILVNGIEDIQAPKADLLNQGKTFREGLINHCPSEVFEIFGSSQELAYFPKLNQAYPQLSSLMRLPRLALTQGKHSDQLQWVCLDDTHSQADGFQILWNGFMRLYNFFQFLPQTWFVSQSGLEQGQYTSLLQKLSTKQVATQVSNEWQVLIEMVDDELIPLLESMSLAEWPMPELGFELTDARGKVLATAEMAFPKQNLVLLLAEESETEELFHNHQWNVVVISSELLEQPDAFLAKYSNKMGVA